MILILLIYKTQPQKNTKHQRLEEWSAAKWMWQQRQTSLHQACFQKTSNKDRAFDDDDEAKAFLFLVGFKAIQWELQISSSLEEPWKLSSNEIMQLFRRKTKPNNRQKSLSYKLWQKMSPSQ